MVIVVALLTGGTASTSSSAVSGAGWTTVSADILLTAGATQAVIIVLTIGTAFSDTAAFSDSATCVSSTRDLVGIAAFPGYALFSCSAAFARSIAPDTSRGTAMSFLASFALAAALPTADVGLVRTTHPKVAALPGSAALVVADLGALTAGSLEAGGPGGTTLPGTGTPL